MVIADERVIGVFFTVLGASIMMYAMLASFRARRTREWPWTEGHIEHTFVRYVYAATSALVTGVHQVEIRYQYTINGAEYISSAIVPGDWVAARGEVQQLAEAYAENAPVRVYYNPSDFSEAVLEPGVPHWLKLLYIPGGSLGITGLLFLLMSHLDR